MRLFYEDYRTGYVDVINNVEKVMIKKDGNVNCLYYKLKNGVGYICLERLVNIKLAFLVDVSGKECKEYFRYEK